MLELMYKLSLSYFNDLKLELLFFVIDVFFGSDLYLSTIDLSTKFAALTFVTPFL